MSSPNTDVNRNHHPERTESSPTVRVRFIHIVVQIADALDLIDATMTTVAAPSVVDDFGGGNAWLSGSVLPMHCPWIAAGPRRATR